MRPKRPDPHDEVSRARGDVTRQPVKAFRHRAAADRLNVVHHVEGLAVVRPQIFVEFLVGAGFIVVEIDRRVQRRGDIPHRIGPNPVPRARLGIHVGKVWQPAVIHRRHPLDDICRVATGQPHRRAARSRRG